MQTQRREPALGSRPSTGWAHRPALWAAVVALIFGMYELFGPTYTVCPSLGPNGVPLGSCRDEGLVAVQLDGVFPVPLLYIIASAFAPLVALAGVRVAARTKVAGLGIIALALAVDASSVIGVKMPSLGVNSSSGVSFGVNEPLFLPLVTGSLVFTFACAPLLLLELVGTARAGKAAGPKGNALIRWLKVVIAIVLVTLAGFVFAGMMAFAYADVGYRDSAQEQARSALEIQLLLAAPVAFDLILVIGTLVRWRYAWPAAAAALLAIVALLWFAPPGLIDGFLEVERWAGRSFRS